MFGSLAVFSMGGLGRMNEVISSNLDLPSFLPTRLVTIAALLRCYSPSPHPLVKILCQVTDMLNTSLHHSYVYIWMSYHPYYGWTIIPLYECNIEYIASYTLIIIPPLVQLHCHHIYQSNISTQVTQSHARSRFYYPI